MRSSNVDIAVETLGEEELRRNDEVYLDALGTRRLSNCEDPCYRTDSLNGCTLR